MFYIRLFMFQLRTSFTFFYVAYRRSLFLSLHIVCLLSTPRRTWGRTLRLHTEFTRCATTSSMPIFCCVPVSHCRPNRSWAQEECVVNFVGTRNHFTMVSCPPLFPTPSLPFLWHLRRPGQCMVSILLESRSTRRLVPSCMLIGPSNPTRRPLQMIIATQALSA